MLGNGGGIPGNGTANVASGHLNAIEIGDKAIIITNVQSQNVEVIWTAAHAEWNANKARGIPGIHLRIKVKTDQLVVARSSVVSDAAGSAGLFIPVSVVETRWIFPVVGNQTDRNIHPLLSVLRNENSFDSL